MFSKRYEYNLGYILTLIKFRSKSSIYEHKELTYLAPLLKPLGRDLKISGSAGLNEVQTVAENDAMDTVSSVTKEDIMDVDEHETRNQAKGEKELFVSKFKKCSIN